MSIRLMAADRSFADLMVATARQKLAAAEARRNPNVLAERPRDAIMAGLRLVADAVAPDGFQFTQSAPKFSRKSGDLGFEIRVQSDRNNIAGERAAIWVHVAVYSKKVTAWRRSHSSDWIRPKAPFPQPFYGTQLGYLCTPPVWSEWNFADTTNRQEVADDLISSIKKGAYPRFSKFEGTIEGIASIADHDWPPSEGILSYLLCQGEDRLAEETLERYLSEHLDFQVEFSDYLEAFRRNGVPTYRSYLVQDLAAFAVSTNYPWTD